jgi:hypothetical protein
MADRPPHRRTSTPARYDGIAEWYDRRHRSEGGPARIVETAIQSALEEAGPAPGRCRRNS